LCFGFEILTPFGVESLGADWGAKVTRFTISGNGLAKICRRLDVPYPPRGYWARKAAGKKVAQTPLPAMRPGTPAQVTITPSVSTPPPAQMPPELQDALTAARRLTAGLRVPDKPLHPHRIVADWIKERRRWREQTKRDPWYGGRSLPADFSAMERRRHRLLSALYFAVEKHGYTAKVDERGKTFVEINREPAVFTLKEKYRQVRRPLTEDEKKRGFNPKRPWKQETQTTGLLQLTIETRLRPGLVDAWIDTAEQTLEQRLPDIAAVAAAPLLKERRPQYEEAERRRRDEDMLRYDEERRRQLEGNRLRGFLELAARAGRRRKRRTYSSMRWRRTQPQIPLKSSATGPSINGSPGHATASPGTIRSPPVPPQCSKPLAGSIIGRIARSETMGLYERIVPCH
jgi:hypothetical protein